MNCSALGLGLDCMPEKFKLVREAVEDISGSVIVTEGVVDYPDNTSLQLREYVFKLAAYPDLRERLGL